VAAGHAHALYVHGHSPVHRLAPEAKVAAAFAFVLAAAVTPRQAVWAFGADAAVLVAIVAVAHLRPGFVLARGLVIAPFLAVAAVIPFVAGGATIDVAGLGLSRAGLWGAWNIAAKATIGVTVSIVLAATTEIPRILRGLDRLRVPSVLTTIAAFMIRYLELIAAEVGRMRTAMTARGYDPRWLWQARPIAAASGALFIRSYERGERVHAAMLARGYTGAMPAIDERTASTRDWALAALGPVMAAGVAAVALVSQS
jgi:cobalt/nickel transport system permease protein